MTATGRGGGAGGLGSGLAEVEQRGGSGGAARGGVVGEWALGDATGVATAAFAGATGADAASAAPGGRSDATRVGRSH